MKSDDSAGDREARRVFFEARQFASPEDFSAFEAEIDRACISGALREVPTRSDYSQSPEFRQRWFVDAAGGTWRLVFPDYPFRGVFEPVDSSQ